MQITAVLTCSYFLVGLLVTMLMDRFRKLELWVFMIGVLTWPVIFPIAFVAGIREMRRRNSL